MRQETAETVRLMSMPRRHGVSVARLHRMALPNAFLSTFDDRFLAELYWGIANVSRSGVWVAVDADDCCLGFVSGTADLRRCYRDVLTRRGLPLLCAGFRRLLAPATLRRVAETLIYPFRNLVSTATRPDAEIDLPELLSIAVDARARGHGVGRRLVMRLESELVTWAAGETYRVVTDATDPQSNLFYQKTGFRLAGSFKHHENEMKLYHKTLPGKGQQAHDTP